MARRSAGKQLRMDAAKGVGTASGAHFEGQVEAIIESVGLPFLRQAKMGVSILGRKRLVDFVAYDENGKSLGIECKYQHAAGSAEDKLVHTIQDFDARPIKHILVFGGDGFSRNVRGYLLSTGKAVEIGELRNYLVFFFGLEEHFQEFGRKPKRTAS